MRETASWPDYAGLRYWATSRRTGTQVAIYHNAEAGFDADGGPWSIMCETHGCLISVQSLRVARSWVGHSDEWCDVDNGCTSVATS